MDSKPKRKGIPVVEEMDDDLLVADFGESQLHILNPTAAAVWDMCDGQYTAEQMADLLAGHFGLPVEDVQDDVVKMLGEFHEKGLIE